MAYRKTSLLVFVLLCLGPGCRTPVQSEHQDCTHDTKERTEVSSSGKSSQFSRTLSETVLRFHLDDCRSTLRDINRAVDSLTPRTQQGYWESIKQRYSESKAEHAQLCQDWSEASNSGAAEPESVRLGLTELERMFLETGKRIEHSDEAYAQQRRMYELKKRQSFAELQAEQGQGDAMAGCFYADSQISLGISDMDVTIRHVLLTLEVYAGGAVKPVPDDLPLPAGRRGLSAVEGLEHCVSLLDQQGQDFGPPLEIEYDRLHSLDGLVVTLAFARDPASDQRPAQLCVRPSPLGNSGPVTFTMPSDQDGEHLARALAREVLLLSEQPEGAGSVGSEIQVIPCQRAGMHLRVPVQVDIHGVDIKTTMLLDTGASVTVLAKSVYSKGLARSMRDLKTVRLRTANGPMTCPVDSLRVSTTAYARTIPVALTNDSMSLLGANYFAGHRITVDLDRECIYVHPEEKQ